MKQLMKWSSLLSMVMLLGMGTMVTSCGDDDDEGGGGGKTINKVVFDGKELTVTKASYYQYDLKKHKYDLYLDFSDGTCIHIMLSGDKHDNQLIDMTKPETDLIGWYWGFDYMDAESQSLIYGDGDATDPDPCDAGSTMKVRCLNKETGEFEVQFVAKQNGHTMNGYYKGNFEPRMTLEGTWEGYTHAYHQFNGQMYQSNRTELTFVTDPFRFTNGTGYWVDYYNDYGWGRNYIANHIVWTVKNGIINIYFREDNFAIQIRDYRLYNDHFVGTIYTADSNIDFSLYKTTDRSNWDGYDFGVVYY